MVPHQASARTRAAEIHQRLLADGGSWAVAASPDHLAALVRREHPLLAPAEVAATADAVAALLHGMGPLDPLLADPEVADVLVNGPGPVWIERAGRLARSGIELARDDIELLIERILGPLGRQVDPVHPLAEGRLADGARVQVAVPPVAVDGPCLAIRRFATRALSLDELAPGPAGELLRWAIEARWNLVVVGSTGAGKTTLLNALAAALPDGERIVTVEDAAELRLATEHVVRLEARPAGADGTPAVTCRDLVRAALRLRPDRLIVGEVRGAEALDMVQAMSTGHDGSLATLHANGTEDAVRRLELLVLLAGIGLPPDAVARHLAAAVDAVVAIERGADGRRTVGAVAELCQPHELRPGAPATRLLVAHGAAVAPVARAARWLPAGPPPGPSGRSS